MDINYGIGEVNLKIVYYGPGLSGKTTNLEMIHQKAPESHKGKLTAIATQQDRTLFFDFMPLDLGKIAGLKTKLRLFTVPGQVFYNSTRKLVLQRVDGVVFVADSQKSKMQENLESLQNLKDNLREYEVDLRNLPIVFQYNKRDLPNIMPIEEMDSLLNAELRTQAFPSVAVKGEGVFATLKGIASMVLKSVEKLAKNSTMGRIKSSSGIGSLQKRFSPIKPNSSVSSGDIPVVDKEEHTT